MSQPAFIRRFIVSYVLTAGRRVVVIEDMLRVARKHGNAALIAELEQAAEVARETFRLVRLWHTEREKSKRSRPDAVAIDNQLDRAITRVRDHAANFADMPGDDPDAVMARKFLAAFYPHGVRAITHQPYEEQLVTVEEMLTTWTQPEWQDTIRELGLAKFIQLITTLTADYREAVTGFVRRDVTWDEVRTAEDAGQTLLASLVARVLGLYPTDAPDDLKFRGEYLEMFDEQNNLTAEYRSRRKGKEAPDVDPDTGTEFEDSDTETETTTEPSEA